MDGRPLRIIRVKCDQMLSTSFVCSDTRSLILSPHIRGLRYISTDREHVYLQCHKDWALIGTVRYEVLTARQDTRTTTDLLDHVDAKCNSFMSGKLLRLPYLKNIIFNALYIYNIAFLMDKLMDSGTGLGIYKTLEAKNKAKGMDIADFIYDKNKDKVYVYNYNLSI